MKDYDKKGGLRKRGYSALLSDVWFCGVEAFLGYKARGYKHMPPCPHYEGSVAYDEWWSGFYTAEDEDELVN